MRILYQQILTKPILIALILIIGLVGSLKVVGQATYTGGTATLDWAVAGNWGGTSAANSSTVSISPNANSQTITINNITNTTLTSLTINAGAFTNTSVIFNAASAGQVITVTSVSLAGSVSSSITFSPGLNLLVNGTFSNACLNGSAINSTTSTLTFGSTGIYNLTGNGGQVPNATWNTGSTVKFSAVTGGAITWTTANPAIDNFTWDCSSQSADINLAGNLSNMTGTLLVNGTGTKALILNSQTSGTYNMTSVKAITVTSGSSAATLSVNVTSSAATANIGNSSTTISVTATTSNAATFNGYNAATTNVITINAGSVTVGNGSAQGASAFNLCTSTNVTANCTLNVAGPILVRGSSNTAGGSASLIMANTANTSCSAVCNVTTASGNVTITGGDGTSAGGSAEFSIKKVGSCNDGVGRLLISGGGSLNLNGGAGSNTGNSATLNINTSGGVGGTASTAELILSGGDGSVSVNGTASAAVINISASPRSNVGFTTNRSASGGNVTISGNGAGAATINFNTGAQAFTGITHTLSVAGDFLVRSLSGSGVPSFTLNTGAISAAITTNLTVLGNVTVGGNTSAGNGNAAFTLHNNVSNPNTTTFTIGGNLTIGANTGTGTSTFSALTTTGALSANYILNVNGSTGIIVQGSSTSSTGGGASLAFIPASTATGTSGTINVTGTNAAVLVQGGSGTGTSTATASMVINASTGNNAFAAMNITGGGNLSILGGANLAACTAILTVLSNGGSGGTGNSGSISLSGGSNTGKVTVKSFVAPATLTVSGAPFTAASLTTASSGDFEVTATSSANAAFVLASNANSVNGSQTYSFSIGRDLLLNNSGSGSALSRFDIISGGISGTGKTVNFAVGRDVTITNTSAVAACTTQCNIFRSVAVTQPLTSTSFTVGGNVTVGGSGTTGAGVSEFYVNNGLATTGSSDVLLSISGNLVVGNHSGTGACNFYGNNNTTTTNRAVSVTVAGTGGLSVIGSSSVSTGGVAFMELNEALIAGATATLTVSGLNAPVTITGGAFSGSGSQARLVIANLNTSTSGGNAAMLVSNGGNITVGNGTGQGISELRIKQQGTGTGTLTTTKGSSLAVAGQFSNLTVNTGTNSGTGGTSTFRLTGGTGGNGTLNIAGNVTCGGTGGGAATAMILQDAGSGTGDGSFNISGNLTVGTSANTANSIFTIHAGGSNSSTGNTFLKVVGDVSIGGGASGNSQIELRASGTYAGTGNNTNTGFTCTGTALSIGGNLIFAKSGANQIIATLATGVTSTSNIVSFGYVGATSLATSSISGNYTPFSNTNWNWFVFNAPSGKVVNQLTSLNNIGTLTVGTGATWNVGANGGITALGSISYTSAASSLTSISLPSGSEGLGYPASTTFVGTVLAGDHNAYLTVTTDANGKISGTPSYISSTGSNYQASGTVVSGIAIGLRNTNTITNLGTFRVGEGGVLSSTSAAIPSGSTFANAGSVKSTLAITGTCAVTSGLNQALGHLTFNCATISGMQSISTMCAGNTAALSIGGNLSVLNTTTTAANYISLDNDANADNVTVAGNLVVGDGVSTARFAINGTGATSAGGSTLNVNGNVTINTLGTLVGSSGTASSPANYAVSGNTTVNGTLDFANGSNAAANTTYTAGGDFLVNSGSTVQATFLTTTPAVLMLGASGSTATTKFRIGGAFNQTNFNISSQGNPGRTINYIGAFTLPTNRTFTVGTNVTFNVDNGSASNLASATFTNPTVNGSSPFNITAQGSVAASGFDNWPSTNFRTIAFNNGHFDAVYILNTDASGNFSSSSLSSTTGNNYVANSSALPLLPGIINQGTITVNGTLNFGKNTCYVHYYTGATSGAIPTANWNTDSYLGISNQTSQPTVSSGWNQSFGNVTISNAAQSASFPVSNNIPTSFEVKSALTWLNTKAFTSSLFGAGNANTIYPTSGTFNIGSLNVGTLNSLSTSSVNASLVQDATGSQSTGAYTVKVKVSGDLIVANTSGSVSAQFNHLRLANTPGGTSTINVKLNGQVIINQLGTYAVTRENATSVTANLSTDVNGPKLVLKGAGSNGANFILAAASANSTGSRNITYTLGTSSSPCPLNMLNATATNVATYVALVQDAASSIAVSNTNATLNIYGNLTNSIAYTGTTITARFMDLQTAASNTNTGAINIYSTGNSDGNFTVTGTNNTFDFNRSALAATASTANTVSLNLAGNLSLGASSNLFTTTGVSSGTIQVNTLVFSPTTGTSTISVPSGSILESNTNNIIQLVVNTSGGAGVSLSGALSVRRLKLSSGILTTDNTNLLYVRDNSVNGSNQGLGIVNASDVNSVSGFTTGNYINGPVKWSVPVNASALFTFPVGTSGATYSPVLMTGPSGTASDVTIEAVASNVTGSVGFAVSSFDASENRQFKYNSTGINGGTITLYFPGSAVFTGSNYLITRSATVNGVFRRMTSATATNNSPTGLSALSGTLGSLSGQNFFAVGFGGSLTGTASVGATGDLLNLTAVANILNSNSLSGNVNFELQSDYDGTTGETYPITFNQWTETGTGGYSVNIYPKTGVTARVTGRTTGGTGSQNANIVLNGTDRITFDGRSGGPASSGTSQEWTFGSNSSSVIVFQFKNDATNNTLNYLKIAGSNTSTTPSSGGIINFGDGTSVGNINNTVSNSIIGACGGSKPFYGIISTNSVAGTLNSGLIITNNEVYDIFTTSNGSTGIYMTTKTTLATITGNSVYNTGDISFNAQNREYYNLVIDAGEGYTISNNYFGGSSKNCGGAQRTIQAGNTGNNAWIRYNAIRISGHSGTALTTISGNVVTNLFVSHSTMTNQTNNNVMFAAISVESGISGNITVEGNFIGDGSTASPATSGSLTIKHSNALTTSDYYSSEAVYGIKIGGGSGGGISTVASGANITNVKNNIVSFGFQADRQLSSQSGSLLEVAGIHINPSNTSVTNVENNTIFNITSTYTNATAPNSHVVAGISVYDQSTNSINIHRNTIYGISAYGGGSSSRSIGIWVRNLTGSQPCSTYNNMISLGRSSSNKNCLYIGIEHDATSATRALHSYYNSVVVGNPTSAPTTSQNTYAFRRNGATNNSIVNLYNNIFYNDRSVVSSESHYAIGFNQTSPSSINSNNNLLYVPSSAIGNLAEYVAATSVNLATYQSASSQDGISKDGNPSGTNPGLDFKAAATGDLLPFGRKICSNGLDNGGVAITGITTDKSSKTRGTIPDFGAREFQGTVGTWYGEVNSDWFDSRNWCGSAIPDPTTDVVFIDDYVQNSPVINTGAASCKAFTGQITNGNSVTLASGSLSIYGDMTFNSGNFIQTGGLLYFAGSSAQSVPAFSGYKTVIIDGTGTKTLAGNVTATDLTVNPGNTLALGTNTFNLTGGLINDGTLTSSTTSALLVNGTGDQIIYSTTDIPANLELNKSTGKTTFNVPSISGSFTLTNDGTATAFASDLTLRGTTTIANSQVLANSGFNINIQGDLTSNGIISGTGTTTLNGSSVQYIFGEGTISNLTIDNPTVIKQSGLSVTVSGTFNLNNGQYYVAGKKLNLNGAINFGSGTLTSQGSGILTIGGSGTIGGTWNCGTDPNLQQFNSVTLSRTGETLTLASDLGISNQLTLSDGTFCIGANTLTLYKPISGFESNFCADGTGSLSLQGSATFPVTVTDINNLTYNSSATSNLADKLTIEGEVNLKSGNFALDINKLAILGNTVSLAALTTTSESELEFSGANTDVTLPTNINNLLSLTFNRTAKLNLSSVLNINGLSLSSSNNGFVRLDNGIILGAGNLFMGNNSVLYRNLGDLDGNPQTNNPDRYIVEYINTAPISAGFEWQNFDRVATIRINNSDTLNLQSDQSLAYGQTLDLQAGLLNIGKYKFGFASGLIKLGSAALITTGESNLEFSSPVAIQIPDNLFASSPVEMNNLTISNTDSVTLGNQNFRVNGVLSFKNGSGFISTSADTTRFIDLGTTGTIDNEGPGRYVKGTLKVARSVAKGSTDFGGSGIIFSDVSAATAAFIDTMHVIRIAGITPTLTYGNASQGLDANQSIRRQWIFDGLGATPDPLKLTVNWLSDEDNITGCGACALTKMSLYLRTDATSEWSPVKAQQYFDATGSGGVRTLTQTISHFTQYTAGYGDAPLPVTLLYFNGKAKENDALINWATQTEENSAWFSLERSLNGKDFQEITRIAAAGNSVTRLNYAFTDVNILAGKESPVYYRLKQTDFDGKTQTFNSISVKPKSGIGLGLAETRIYPNPFKNGLNIEFGSELETLTVPVQLVDVLGKTVFETEISATKGFNSQYLVIPSEVPAGTYNLSINLPETTIHQKLVRIQD